MRSRVGELLWRRWREVREKLAGVIGVDNLVDECLLRGEGFRNEAVL
jgi:hypothetical protein